MSYTVLARKYRPQTFADLVGQEHVSRTLENAIRRDRVAHAFLFTGARGTGKTTTARLLAKALNCEKGATGTPCNDCDACREIAVGTDLDVLEIDGASNNSVDDVRRLQETLPYRPARDRFKIVIVDEVHMLSPGAFNAFLKTLEEPPPHVKFVFATTEIHKVPITIRSRCQRHDFRLIPRSVVATRVREILAAEGIEADDGAVALVAREAAGSMRDALTVLDQLLAFGGERLEGAAAAEGLGIAARGHVMAVSQALLEGDAAGCLRAISELGEQGIDLLHFGRQLLSFVRDVTVLRVVGDDHELVELVDEERKRADALSKAHSPQHIERCFAGLNKLVDEVAQSASPQLTLEMGLVRLADRPALEPLAELIARLHELERRLAGSGPSGGGSGGGREAPGKAGAGAGAGAAAGAGRTPAKAPPRAAPPPERQDRPDDEGPPSQQPRAVGQSQQPGAAAPQPTAATRPPPRANENGGIPPVWGEIVARLQQDQPALGAVLEHGVAASLDAERVVVRFPEGSFFGRQADTPAARAALAGAAAQVLGQRPEIAIEVGGEAGGRTLAAENAAQLEARRADAKKAALAHPRVRDAMEIFPEGRDSVEVQVEVDR